jgi:hypothetical protein
LTETAILSAVRGAGGEEPHCRPPAERLDSALSIAVPFLNPVEECATQGEGGKVIGLAVAS